MRKYEQIGRLLKTRVRHGDYYLNEVPPERALAAEMGVSYMTARRAVQALIDDGYLFRQSNGRLAANPAISAEDKTIQVAVLLIGGILPNWGSYELEAAARKAGVRLRSVLANHWEDPTLIDAVNSFNGAFLFPSTTAMQPSTQVIQKLSNARKPVIILDADWSDKGFPSIQPFPPTALAGAMDYLASLGHTKIDCLNVQPIDATGLLRIEQWQTWQAQHSALGELFNLNFQGLVYEMAHAFMKARLEEGYRPEAILCITVPAAIGSSRALCDFGIMPGKDVSLIAVNGEEVAEFVRPSITAIERASLTPPLVKCMKWLAAGEKWSGPLNVETDEPQLVIRESTIPPRLASH
ncbi:MAG: GntR family transcriptional regulator [Capsulimonadaceae bacterium]|nr:GntR family transcriptional regulator [Capsulimonadaceae bacterium]